MEKLADKALLPFYCQNRLIALLLIHFKLELNYIAIGILFLFSFGMPLQAADISK